MKPLKEYEDTTLAINVEEIIKKSKGTRLFIYEATLHTPEENIGLWGLDGIETLYDYINNVHHMPKLKFNMGLGDYIYRLFPYRNNLEMTIRRIPMKEHGIKKNEKEKIQIKRWKVIFNPKNNPPVAGSDLQHIERETLNNTDMPEIQVELVDRHAEPLRVKYHSGIYQKKKIEDVIRATLAYEAKKVIVDGKPAVDALEMKKPDNKDEIEHIVFPSGTLLHQVPTILHDKIGVYIGGLGTYYQEYRDKKTWFVYPFYDEKAFDEADYRVIFYAIPQDRQAQLDMSYWEDDKTLKVVVTGQRLYSDSAELDQMNKGSGFRSPDAEAMMLKPHELDVKHPIANRSRLNTELIDHDRTDNLNYAPIMNSKQTANLYVRKTEVLSYQFAQVDFVWENADETLIYPGMPCKYHYLVRGEVKELKGRVLFKHVFSTRVDRQDVGVFRTVCRISIGVTPQKEFPTNEYIDRLKTERDHTE